MTEPQHIASEFNFNSKGKVITVKEETPEVRAARVFHVAVCPEGFREDNPPFGVPELAWNTVPLNLQGFQAAIRRSEPAANLESTEKVIAQIQSEREVNIEVA